MKKKTLAWAIKWPDGSYLTCSLWTKESAKYASNNAKVVRVEIKEVVRKK